MFIVVYVSNLVGPKILGFTSIDKIIKTKVYGWVSVFNRPKLTQEKNYKKKIKVFKLITFIMFLNYFFIQIIIIIYAGIKW